MNKNDKVDLRLVEKLKPLQALIDCLPDQIYLKDTKGRFILCNRATAEITQFKNPAELIGKTDFDTCKPEDARNFREEEQQIIKTGVPLVNHELITVNREGQTFWSLITKLPWRDDSGNIIGIIGSNRNITEHKKAQLALLESEARYKAVFESARVGIIFADVQTRCFRYANPAACKMFGYTDEEFTQKSVDDIHPQDYLSRARSDFDVRAKGVDKELSQKVPCARKDGTTFYADINSTRILVDNHPCLIGFFTDITSHIQAEEALRHSEARYKAIFNSAIEGILVADIETKRFKYANPAICRMFGFTVDEWQKLSVPDIHPKDAVPFVMSEFEAQARGEKTLASNIPCLRKDGTMFYSDINTTNVILDERPCNVGLFTDITERKLTEEALRESEQRYRLLVEQLPAITYTAALDEKSTTLYTSPQVKEILGITPTDYKEDPDLWRKLIHPDDHNRVLLEVAESHRTGKPFTSEYRMLTKDGRIVWIRDDARIVKDSKGSPMYLQGVMYNITERKNAEQKLREAHNELEARVLKRTTDLAQAVENLQQEIAERRRAEESLRKAEQRFRTIFENTVVGLYRTTPDGKILLVNPALIKMFGCKSFEELAQMNLEKEGFDQSTPRSKFKKLIEKHGSVVGLESVWIKRDGSKLYVSESASVVKDEQGNILYYEGTVLNVTKRKEAEAKLMHYQQQLRSSASQLSLAEERLRRRIATELHDHISQNLAISKMKLDALIDTADAKRVECLHEIADALAQIIETTRTLTFEVSPPVLYELGFVAAVGWLTRQTKRRFGLNIEFTDDGKAKKLNADVRVLLFQAVRELLVNVVKHAQAGKVYVTTKKVRDNIRIIVEDDGVGFDATNVRPSDYTKGGFGLFNIRERIDQIDGKFELYSSPGKGTKITLTAPLLKSSKKRTNRRQHLKRS